MSKLLQFSAAGLILLMLGFSTLVAQEVVYTAGPAVTPVSGASNGGFAWGDVNGDGKLDVWIPSNSILLNSITSFTRDATKTANVTFSSNTVGGLLADINGDGVLDLWSTNDNHPEAGLYYDSSGVLIRATGTGDLATASGAGMVFEGMAIADINRDNYLDVAWPRFTGTWSDGALLPRGLGISMYKGGASGFTNIGNGATPGNLAIDTLRSFESWSVHFFDANNDGWQDLLMPSFRHGFSQLDIPNDSIGSRKGCVLYLNDGTGKFVVPTSGSFYNVDSISGGVSYGRAVADTGIVVDDTVRHFNAIGSTWGELNNDGNFDLILMGSEARNWNGNGALVNIAVLYGKGNGTFTYKWNGTNIVSHGLPSDAGIRAWDIGDYNNDGVPDVFASPNFSPPRMFRGNGNGTFTEVSSQIFAAQPYPAGTGGRAGGIVDYDNDGWVDTYTYTGGKSYLSRNSGNSNHWIAFTPVGTGKNKSAVGARFTLYAQGGTLKQTRVIKAEAGAPGGQMSRANFGIGINTSIDSVVVWWPDGTTQTFAGLAVDQYWTVIQGSTIPNLATLASPADAATGVAQTGTMTWNPAAGAVSYKVQVSMDATFENEALLAVDATVSDTSFAFSLGAATQYYWRVAGINGGFMGVYSATNDFTTAGSAATVVPTKISPIGNATGQAASLMLKVNKTSDASRYNWQVSSLPSFTSLYANETTADTTVTVQFVGGQTFYWRVRGVNGLGASAYSAVDTFTIMAPPARPTLLLPASNAQNVISDSVTFTWSTVASAASYNLQVSTVNSTTTYTGITDTTKEVFGLAKLTNYTWKVEAINAGGTSYYTNNFAFTTIIAAPATPVALLPANSAANVGRLGPFSWNSSANATKYRLQIATDNAFVSIVKDTTINIDTTATLKTPLTASTDYYWKVNAQNIGGASSYSGPRIFTTGTALDVEDVVAIPQQFQLYQNYPNPFNPTTMIRYDIPTHSHVKIVIYDMLGQAVANLVDGIQVPGRHTTEWNPSGLGSGVYFLRIIAQAQDGSGVFTSVKKLLFMK